MRERILDQPIDIIKFEEAIFRIKAAYFYQDQFKIITLNPEMIVNAESNIFFQAAINNADMIVPDGAGIIWALKEVNQIFTAEKIPGVELASRSLEIADELNKRVSILGSTKENLDACINNLKNTYTSITFVKSSDGYYEQKDEEIIAKEISNDKPDLLLVALGSPRQEEWINKYSDLFPNSIIIGIGGSIDIWSGNKNRAPGWMIDMNLEWLYRITSEPKRIPRVLKTHPKFIKMVLNAKKSL